MLMRSTFTAPIDRGPVSNAAAGRTAEFSINGKRIARIIADPIAKAGVNSHRMVFTA
jgi:hypothetical protein